MKIAIEVNTDDISAFVKQLQSSQRTQDIEVRPYVVNSDSSQICFDTTFNEDEVIDMVTNTSNAVWQICKLKDDEQLTGVKDWVECIY